MEEYGSISIQLPHPLTGQQIIDATVQAIEADNIRDKRNKLVLNQRGEHGFRLGQYSPWPQKNISVNTNEQNGLIIHDRTYVALTIISGGDWGGAIYAVNVPPEGYIAALEEFAANLKKFLPS
jgi:hypothetical protein